MNRKDLYNGFNEVDDDILERSETVSKSKKKPMWLKWGAIAACLCLVVSIAIPVLHHKGGPNSDDPLQGDAAPFFHNGCYCETVDDPEILKKYGLPRKITADMAGDHVAYIEINYDEGFVSFEATPVKTDMELYVYAPAPSSGVYVYREGDTYMAAIFCNFEMFGSSNTNYELTELYRVYNIEGAEDIASISEVDWHNNKVIGATVTDVQEISEFYNLTVALWSYGNDDFQKAMFDGIPEEEQQEMHTAFADDLRSIRIETVTGLCFYISLFPSYDWMSSSGTMSYYQINEQMHAWIDRNLN